MNRKVAVVSTTVNTTTSPLLTESNDFLALPYGSGYTRIILTREGRLGLAAGVAPERPRRIIMDTTQRNGKSLFHSGGLLPLRRVVHFQTAIHCQGYGRKKISKPRTRREPETLLQNPLQRGVNEGNPRRSNALVITS